MVLKSSDHPHFLSFSSISFKDQTHISAVLVVQKNLSGGVYRNVSMVFELQKSVTDNFGK
ncbi:hypothetical protein TW74_08800 [Vibrio nigripulchritudo]|nr:hypothetical protein TW74_08800 [Vibrio nigripulchritudo]